MTIRDHLGRAATWDIYVPSTSGGGYPVPFTLFVDGKETQRYPVQVGQVNAVTWRKVFRGAGCE